MRDITLAETIFPKFTTRAFATGIPTTLAGTPVVSAYENDSLTQITAGVTLGVDHDSVAGFNMVTVVATGANGFESGKEYQLVITTGTVGGVSVVGEIIGEFTIDSSAALKAVDLLNDVAATDIVSAGAITTSSGAVSSVTTVATTTTNTDMRGTDSALLAASINLTAGAVDNVTTVATTTTNTDMRGTDSALLAASINLTAGAVDNVTTVATTTTNTDMRGTDSALLAANINLTAGAIDNVTLVATTTANTDMVAEPTTLLTTQMTQSYAADGIAPTVAQALFIIQQTIGDFSIAGTTITVKQLDGSTTAATYTLDGGTNPTSRTRTT